MMVNIPGILLNTCIPNPHQNPMLTLKYAHAQPIKNVDDIIHNAYGRSCHVRKLNECR